MSLLASAKALTSEQFLIHESRAALLSLRKRCPELDHLTVEQFESSMAQALASLSAESKIELDENAVHTVVKAIYAGDYSSAIWMIHFVASRGDASLRTMFQSYGFNFDAILSKAQDIAATRAH